MAFFPRNQCYTLEPYTENAFSQFTFVFLGLQTRKVFISIKHPPKFLKAKPFFLSNDYHPKLVIMDSTPTSILRFRENVKKELSNVFEQTIIAYALQFSENQESTRRNQQPGLRIYRNRIFGIVSSKRLSIKGAPLSITRPIKFQMHVVGFGNPPKMRNVDRNCRNICAK